MTTRYFLGCDLGQRRDYATLAVMERWEERGEWDPVQFAYRKRTSYALRRLERYALRTSYPAVAERVGDVAEFLRETACGSAGQSGVKLAVDGTGVGRPVVDLLKGRGLAGMMYPVVVSSGQREGRVDDTYTVPKQDLIAGLRVAIERKTLQISAGMKNREALVEEFGEIRFKTTAGGHPQFGAWKGGAHDDLVFAVALGCWVARKTFPQDFSVREKTASEGYIGWRPY